MSVSTNSLGASELATEIDQMVERAFEKVENVSFAALGGVGLLLLMWMVVDVLGRVETAFNRVWGVKAGRPVWRRFTDYLSVLVVLPVLAVAASSLPVVDFVARYLDKSTADAVRAFLVSGPLKSGTVVTMTALCFTFVIMFMPNTKVRVWPGVGGGTVTAILFIVWMRICAALQVGVANYGKIYGSFAVVPIVLAWVYVSWQIVLFGAEVAFAIQNHITYRMEGEAHRANVQARILLSLSVLTEAARAMLGKAAGFEIAAYAREKGVSVRFVNEVVRELTQGNLLAEVAGSQGRLVLLRSPSSLRVHEVIDVILHAGVEAAAVGLSNVNQAIERTLKEAMRGMDTSLKQATIQDLLEESKRT
jgi:membrane protein